MNLSLSFVASIASFFVAHSLIPVFMPMTEKAGLWGKDLCKKGMKDEDKKMWDVRFVWFID